MFQTNELVRVKNLNKIKDTQYCVFVPPMNKYCGEIFRIKTIRYNDRGRFRFYMLENDWNERFIFLDNWLEPAEAVEVDDFPETITSINITDEELDAMFKTT